jgi:WD40 repeat protein
MDSRNTVNLSGSSAAVSEQRESALRRFEAAWRAGLPPRLEDYLPDHPAQRLPVLLELIHLDLEYRLKAGQNAGLEDYQRRFPELSEQRSAALSILAAEYHLRKRQDQAVTLAEYQQRFPQFGADLDQWLNTPTPSDPGRPPEQFRPGSLGIPGYEIMEELGRGGMGIVYKARQLALNRLVALKTILVGRGGDPDQMTRFLNEAEAVARMQHPGIVQVFEVNRLGGWPYFTMELVEGGTLSQKVKQLGPLPARDAAHMVLQLAKGVAYAHQRGVIHRDLKPTNVLLGEDGAPRISDFGLAKHLDRMDAALTETGAVLGTPNYMAPEQAEGKSGEVNALCDVYALGAILYETMTGKPPFQGGMLEVLDLVRTQDPAPPRRWQKHLPRDLETICLKCLQKEPGKRYPTAQALADDLQRFLNHEPIIARRIGAVGRLTRWCRRQPALAITGGLSLLAIVLIAFFSLRQVLDERQRFRQERDRAEENLYRSLLSESRAQITARPTGWLWKAQDNILQASKLNVPNRNVDELRDLALQCLNTEHPCFRQEKEWHGHAAPIHTVAMNADATLAASAAEDRTIHIWTIPEGKLSARLLGVSSFPRQLLFHPKGRWVGAGLDDGRLLWWDLDPARWHPEGPTQELAPAAAHTFPQPGALRTLALTPDGATLAVAGDNHQIWVAPWKMDPAQAQAKVVPTHTLKGHQGRIQGLAFSPNGKRLVSTSADATIRFWDFEKGQLVDLWNLPDDATVVAWSKDSNIVAWSQPSSQSGMYKILPSGPQYGQLAMHPRPVTMVRLDGKGHFFTAARDGAIKIWTRHWPTNYFREIAVAQVDGADILAADTDCHRVVCGHVDGKMRVWELVEPDLRMSLGFLCQSAVFHPQSDRLFSDVDYFDLSHGRPPTRIRYAPTQINGLAVHPNGATAVIANEKGEISWWNLANQKQVAGPFQVPGGPLDALAFDLDGAKLAGGCREGQVLVWEKGPGVPPKKIPAEIGPVGAVAWSKDGRWLAADGEHGTVVMEIAAGYKARRLSGRSQMGGALDFGMDCLAMRGPDNTIEIRDQDHFNIRSVLKGHTEDISVLRFSTDTLTLASSGKDATIRLWDLAAGRETKILSEGDIAPRWLTFHPRGHLLATGMGQKHRATMVWDVETKTHFAMMYPGGDFSGQFLPNGQSLLMGGPRGTVRLARTSQLEDLMRAQRQAKVQHQTWRRFDPVHYLIPGGHINAAWGVAASPDGRWVATMAHEGTVKIWDADRLNLLHTLHATPEWESNPAIQAPLGWSVAFSSDGKYVASGAYSVKVWHVETGKLVHESQDHNVQGSKRLVVALAFHPQKPWLVSSADDATVRLFDYVQGKSLGVVHGNQQTARSLMFSPDGHWLAGAFHDGLVRLFDFTELTTLPCQPRHVLRGHVSPAWSVAFSADGGFLASGDEQSRVLLRDAKDFRLLTELRAEAGQVRCLTFSPSGRYLAGAAYQGPAVIFDLQTMRNKLKQWNLDW